MLNLEPQINSLQLPTERKHRAPSILDKLPGCCEGIGKLSIIRSLADGSFDDTMLLIEGTVCSIGLTSDRRKIKQDKYGELREDIEHQYLDYKVNQVSVVFDFLAEYHQGLQNNVNEYLTGKKEEKTQCLIMYHITKCRNS